MDRESDDIRKILLSTESLPTMPEVLARIWQMAEDPKVGARELAEIVKFDPALVLQTLKVANGAQFGLKRPVTSVREAISYLGTSTIKNLTITLLVKNGLLPRRHVPLNFNRLSFWRHSVGTAFGCEVLAARLHPEVADSAFLAGLLHDVGVMVVDSVAPDKLSTLIDRIDAGSGILDADSQVLGCTHPDVGRLVGEAWGLPTAIVAPIAHHHDPLGANSRDRTLACLVSVADSMMTPQEKTCFGAEFPEQDARILEFLKLDRDAIAKAQEDVSAKLNDAAELLALVGS